MAAPGRACSRQTTEVNFPDIVENSYTQQEETKPSFRDSKNRLLLSQVAYFQNYQLKTDKDRKDDYEEQKYRDRKNKLFLSQVAYYLGCRHKTEVPGFLCCAPKVNMVASGRPPFRINGEVNVPEGIEKSGSQQEENKPNVGASKNRLLLSQVAYFQNYRMKTDSRFYDREDHDEEQKYRDSKNKLVMSQVAYYLACRLRMKVPGFLYCYPNISRVDSGKLPSRKDPEVNVPEAIEKSCSQREDNKPDVGVRRNRCLLSEVDYSLNYRLRAYEAREDDDEEWRDGDSKKKLLVNRVVYSLACQLTTEVPGFPCSTPNVITVSSGRAIAGKLPGVNVPEAIEKFCSQREDNKPDVGVRRNRCLLSEVDYSLNYGLRAYDAREDDDEERRYGDSKKKLLVSRVVYSLTCQLTTEVPGFPCSAPNVITVASGRAAAGRIPGVNVPEAIEKSCSRREDKPDVGVRRNRCLLSEVDYSLNYGLRAYGDQDYNEKRKYRESKNKHFTSQAAFCLGSWLKTKVPGFLCSAPNVHMVASGRPSRINPEVNVPEGTEKFCSQQEENKPNAGTTENRLLLSQVAYFQNYRLKSDKDRKGHDEEQKYRDRKNKLLMSQVAYYLGCQHKTEVPGFLLSASNISKVASGRPPYRKYTEVNVPEGIEKSCSQQENNKPNVRVSKNRCLLSEVNYSLNCRLKTYNDQKDHDEEQKCRDSKNKHLRSQAAYYLDCRLKTEGSQGDVEEEEEKGPVPPRNLQESVEEEAPQESWDEGDSTLSVPPGPSAFNETLRSNLHSLEEQQVISAVDIDKIKNDQEEEEDQGPPCPRLSMELVEAEEPEVFRYSLDVLYSTYAAYPEFYFTCQAYTYVIFLFVEERVRLTLDMDSRFLTTTVTRLLPLVSRVGVIFPH
uniref:uncharacterized protein LOC128930149 isoform X8 n=1 Tax=Callithrix jacchus TaxID=9483 RepID=UPI0023DD3D09|nr:uncharacterized protein LOC128930149 isoform X8 [Callithrix jacchus]